MPSGLREGIADDMGIGLAMREDRVGFALGAVLGIAALPFLVATLLPPANHDMAAILHFTQRWLGGERLYVDLIDMNPPLIFILSMVPVVLSRILDTGVLAQAVLCVHALAAWSAVATWRLAAPRTGSRDLARFLVPPLVLFLAAPLVGPSFGQREHLMTLAALPYLFMAAARAEGRPVPRRQAVIATIVATSGFCLKPYFLAIPALVELFVLARSGWTGDARARPENLPLMVALGAAYAVLVATCFPAYLGEVVPLAARHYAAEICCATGKDSLGHFPVIELLGLPGLRQAALVALPAVLLGLRPGASARVRIFALATIGALAAGLVQRKGWEYHFIPFEGFLAALCVLLAADLLSRAFLVDGATRRSAGAGLAIVAIFATGYAHVLATRNILAVVAAYEGSGRGRLVETIRGAAEGRPVLVLSPGILPFFPALNYARAGSPSPFMSMWLLQGAYRSCLADGRRYREPAEMDAAEAMLFARVVESFVRSRPAMVIVDRRAGIRDCGAPFDFIAYFERDPRFASELRAYRHSDAASDLHLDIYVRRDDRPAAGR